jgi:hypothetical protein
MGSLEVEKGLHNRQRNERHETRLCLPLAVAVKVL